MSHLLLHEHITQVDTEHGPLFVAAGESPKGPRAVLVGPGDDRTDHHLTITQLDELIAVLGDVRESLANREVTS